jgi:four helix bundle protein
MYNHEKLIVWQKADELASEVYRKTKQFPREEIYGLTSQIRRAAVSVPTNIAEGAGRQNRNETRQFLNIALGSLAEVHYFIHFCRKEGLLSEKDHDDLSRLREAVGSLLWKFYKSFAI